MSNTIDEARKELINEWKELYKDSSEKWATNNGVGRYHAKKTIENYRGDVSKVNKWLDKPVTSLLIRSETTGNGKSHLAVGALQEYTKRYVDRNDSTPLVLFVSFTKLLLAIRSTYEDKEKVISDADIILTLGDIDLLIVDDFGAEKCSAFVLATMYAIFNSRYENCLPTIFTTNLSYHEIEVNYTSRILSRMTEGDVINVDGEDQRLLSKNDSVKPYDPIDSFRVLTRIAHMKKLIEERSNFKTFPKKDKIDGVMIEFV
jgi:hypothetical protein